MSQQPTDVQATPDAPTTPDVEPRTDLATLPPDVLKMIADLRKEAGEYRVRAKTEAEQRNQAEQARLAQQQEWQKLAELTAKERDDLKAKAEKADALEAFLQSTVAKRIDALAQPYRSLVPQYDEPLKTLEWLDANAGILGRPQPPQTDAGVRGDSSATLPKLSPEEMQLAKLAGMTDEQYAQYKARRNAPAPTN